MAGVSWETPAGSERLACEPGRGVAWPCFTS